MSEDVKLALQEYAADKKRSRKQKFFSALQQYAVGLGYPVQEEQGTLGCKNLVIGDPSRARFLLTSGGACSGVTAWLETLKTFPENQRSKVSFVFFDGKRGESSFCRAHKTDKQLQIHLDHVGDGNHLRMFPTKALVQDRLPLTSLYRACGYFGTTDLLVEETKIPFDLRNKRFCSYAVTIRALQEHKKGMRFNSKPKDTAFDETNINILRAALTTLICCDEVN